MCNLYVRSLHLQLLFPVKFTALVKRWSSLTLSYSYSYRNMSLKLLRRALIMRFVLTEPEKKKTTSALNWIVG